MPIYLDLHIAPGVTAKEVAEAHVQDVNIQHKFCCKAMTYWFDENRGSVFCLIEAPDKESVRELHTQSHGLVPHQIIEVNSTVVEAFLGRIADPDNAVIQSNLKVFEDPAFRIIMVTQATDSRLFLHRVGKERAQELMLLHNATIREQILLHDGREVDLKEEGFAGSFVSVVRAVECAQAIQRRLHVAGELLGLRIGLHAGEPVQYNDRIFGSTLNFARYLCCIGKDNQIILSASVGNQYKWSDLNSLNGKSSLRWLSATDESFLESLIQTLNKHWQNPDFGVNDFCREMSISKPQLYRKSIAITGMSPNNVLREYRLKASLELLRSEDQNIAQTTFDTGFSSPSYFTKCFQRRFGLQPLAYQKTEV